MRGQWGLILGLFAAIMIAIFAVINVNGVRVNYLFGTAEWPLILVILGSVFMGAIIAGALGMVRIYRLQGEIKRLKNHASEEKIVLEQNGEEAPLTRKRYKKEINE